MENNNDKRRHCSTYLERLVRFDPRTLTSSQAMFYVHRYFCKPMRRISQCTTHCDDCKARLKKAFERVPLAENPLAVLTFDAREQAAAAAEEGERMAVPAMNRLGVPLDANPFELLLRQL